VSSGHADPRKVFVIHGRNELARRATFEFLRSLGLQPIEWSQAIDMTGQGSPYIGDVLDAAFGAAQAVLVLQTPDDVAYLHESLTYPGDPESQAQMQPRPNVLFEAGMAMGRDPDRTIIVELGAVKSFSDIHGRHVVRLDNSVGKRQSLAQRLMATGCAVDLSGTDWHVAGDLTPPAAPGVGLSTGQEPSDDNAGADLLRRRREAGLSRTEVALSVGVSPATVARWESGGSAPKAALRAKALAFFQSVESGSESARHNERREE